MEVIEIVMHNGQNYKLKAKDLGAAVLNAKDFIDTFKLNDTAELFVTFPKNKNGKEITLNKTQISEITVY